MHLSKVEIENFRVFGEGDKKFTLSLNPGMTAIVGENDAGKTALIDAIRLVLGTRDQEYFRAADTDFHIPPGQQQTASSFSIRCEFDGLTVCDKGAFAEYLTYIDDDDGTPKSLLIVTLKAKKRLSSHNSRRFNLIEVRSGACADGSTLDVEARSLLSATYLRPLRDAERAMSSGRGSRLSQILKHTNEVNAQGSEEFDLKVNPTPDVSKLSVLGVGDYANHLLQTHPAIQGASKRLNTSYLKPLALTGDGLEGVVSIGSQGDDSTRLRLLLEKLELQLSTNDSLSQSAKGLGSNNLLFMACELLLLGSEEEGFPLLLIEEPEAHLHPQRQLRLMQFLQAQSKDRRTDEQQIQIIVTTHSPSLASAIKLDNMVLIRDGKGFPLSKGNTLLAESDYRFLERFLDATKANLFFARGVMIVEGDAENILFPTLAKLIGHDFTEHGVSIVNVGHTGLSRYAKILQRYDEDGSGDGIPVSCVTDLDVMPDCAPVIIGKIKEGDKWPVMTGKNARKWRAKKDLGDAGITKKREVLCEKDGQGVKTFPADEWTLEYDLALGSLARTVYFAACLAKADDAINKGAKSEYCVISDAIVSYLNLPNDPSNPAIRASHIYALFAKDKVSKAIAAQYLAALLDPPHPRLSNPTTPEGWMKALPPYIVQAIKHVAPKSDGLA
tara:strand:- start:4977 stop:6983 length:2007 start_codon:yes stop_codon:yes gene_type:complete